MKKILLDCGVIFTSKRENNRLAILLVGSTFNQVHVVMEKVGLLCSAATCRN